MTEVKKTGEILTLSVVGSNGTLVLTEEIGLKDLEETLIFLQFSVILKLLPNKNF